MSNEDFLKFMQEKYNSLKYFSIKNGTFILNYNNSVSFIPLKNFKFSYLNYNLYNQIFSLTPFQIYHIIYMFELLYKQDNLTLNEEKYIEDYVSSYNKLSSDILSNSDESNIKLHYTLGIPIDFSYDEFFQNYPTSIKIRSIIESNVENSRGPRLVLKNSNFPVYEENSILDDISEYSKAGFTTFLLISLTVISVCIFLILFVFQN